MSISDSVKNAGIVGAGGAGFPTHVKINGKADVVIANGAECEPLLRVDQQIMQYFADDIVAGMRAVMEQTSAKRGVIALKSHYHDAVSALKKVLPPDMELLEMKSFYPAGDEQELVYMVTGNVVPTGGLPLDAGAVVDNVSTLKNIADALKGIPVTSKFVTVGGAVANPITVNVPIGTPLSKLIDMAGGTTCACKYILGGPCMGAVLEDAKGVVTKTTGGLLAIPEGHPLLAKKSPGMDLNRIKAVCCQCSMCSQMCPRNAMGLNVQPHKAMRSIAFGDLGLLGQSNGIFSCSNCGTCTYFACNFGLKPSLIMQAMKAKLMENGTRAQKEIFGVPDAQKELKRVPTERLIQRLGIKEYDVPAPIDLTERDMDTVTIPLRMHIGAPSVPKVAKGDRVSRGDLIAEIPEGKLGANIHASITGTVSSVTENEIVIVK